MPFDHFLRRHARPGRGHDDAPFDAHRRPGRGGGHGGGGPDGHRHGRGERGGRVFDHGELRLVILALIAEHPRHGYDLIKAIEERLGGSYSPSPGVVYPTLTMLEELGHATVSESASKKLYAITDEGRAYLAANADAVTAAMGRMAERAARPDATPPQLIRAWENLRLALRLRQASGPLPDAALHAIVTALDSAAVAVERS